MHPPSSIIVTSLDSLSVRPEVKIFKAGTILLLVQACRGRIETGPGVKDDGTILLVGGDGGQVVGQCGLYPAGAVNQPVHQIFRGDEVGRIGVNHGGEQGFQRGFQGIRIINCYIRRFQITSYNNQRFHYFFCNQS